MTVRTGRRCLSASLPRRATNATAASDVIALVVAVAVGALSALAQVSAQVTTDAPNAAAVGSVSLRAILEHQNALESQCAQLELETRRKLSDLNEFERSHELVHLPRPLPVQVPAVCVLLRESIEPPPTSSSSSSAGLAKRLQMVNWIFDDADAGEPTPSAAATGVVKRHAAAATERDFGLANPSDSLVNNYLFDVGASGALNNGHKGQATDDDADTDNDEIDPLRQQIDSMLADEKFQNAIGSARKQIGAKLSPVVLVPGLLGSRLQARTSKLRRVNIFCSKHTDWQDVWLSLRAFLPWAVDCWLDNARLVYDPQTGFARQPEGVEARVPDFGSVESVRHLDLRSPTLTGYFEPIIKRYEQLGYTPDENLLAAPYDFRLAPQQLFDTYFVQLRHLIEQAQTQSTNQRPVTLVCHSMGCTHLLAFLRRQPAAWRQKRIRKLISIGSPWAGSGKSLKALVVGDQLELPLVSVIKMRKLARTFPSIAGLLPQAAYFSAPTNGLYPTNSMGPNLVETPERAYNVNQMQELLRDLNLTLQWNWFDQTTKLIDPKEPLADVHIDCIHSLNIPTPLTLRFKSLKDLPDGDYKLVTGDGDGTVNYESLMVCSDWAQKLPDKVKHKVILNTNHMALLSHKHLLDHLTDDVLING